MGKMEAVHIKSQTYQQGYLDGERAGFEAGKQERDREIIEKLREKVGSLEKHYQNDETMAAFVSLQLYLSDLENLSK